MVVVVVLALAAALCFATASVLQQRAAVEAPRSDSLRVGLLIHLVQRPRWLAGVIADAAGYALQVLALDLGPIVLVQPVLATGLLFALVFNRSAAATRGLRRRDWLAALVMAAGLAAFVIAGNPGGDRHLASATGWALFVAASAAVVLGLVAAGGRRHDGPARAALLAAAAGVTFGVSAALTKQSLHEWHHGLVTLLSTPYVYVLVVSGGAGMLLSQSAFQAGPLAASLPMLTLAEPLYATLGGVLLFGEHLRSGVDGALAVLAATCSAGAVVFIARSPRAQPLSVP